MDGNFVGHEAVGQKRPDDRHDLVFGNQAYGKELVAACQTDPLIGEFAGEALTHYATTTREPSERMGRITTLISNGKFYEDLGIEPLNPETDRIMICGSMAMLKEIKALAESLGFIEGSVSLPGQFVVERAFVD